MYPRFVRVITLDLSGMEEPTSSIHYGQHSRDHDHMTTHVPPLHQNRDTFFMFSAPEFTSRYFVRDSGSRGKEG